MERFTISLDESLASQFDQLHGHAEFDGDTLTAVRNVPVTADGRAQVDIGGLGNGRRAVVAVSGLAPVTTLPAHYDYSVMAK